MKLDLLLGDARERLKELADGSIDSIVTDPPYELAFMGKSWDKSGIAFNKEVWEECLRVLKPGGYLLAFGGSRTYHRMASAIEDAGFEIRDQIMWLYGSGFPKSLDVSKALDKAAGAEREVIEMRRSAGGRTTAANPMDRDAGVTNKYDPVTAPATDAAKQWAGWGTALKPAHEPIVVARKPLIGTVAANVLRHGTGALNIDGCRVGIETRTYTGMSAKQPAVGTFRDDSWVPKDIGDVTVTGRWPANVIHDGSDEVLDEFSKSGESGCRNPRPRSDVGGGVWSPSKGKPVRGDIGDSGTPARFFYCAKANRNDREEGLDDLADRPVAFSNQAIAEMKRGVTDKDESEIGLNHVKLRKNNHPTVKPTALMRYLVKLVTPPGGTVLDPFTGSGTTGKAALLEGFNFVGIELNQDYLEIAQARIEYAGTMEMK